MSSPEKRLPLSCHKNSSQIFDATKIRKHTIPLTYNTKTLISNISETHCFSPQMRLIACPDHKTTLKWHYRVTPFEFHTPPVEDSETFPTGGVWSPSRSAHLAPLNEIWNIYSLCNKPNLKTTQKVGAFENSHSPWSTLLQNLPQGVYRF